MDSSISKLANQIKGINTSFKKDLSKLSNISDFETCKAKYLGKKSKLQSILEKVYKLSAEDKKVIGKEANLLKVEIAKALDEKFKELKLKGLKDQEEAEEIDVTLPGIKTHAGHTNVITQTIWQCEDIFQKMGFEIEYPYQIDDDYHNFESVNIPPNHPARDGWDTFWTKDGQIAITHTSSMQNRVIKSHEPPIRVIIPGRCFRNEATDPRHEHTFYQIEGVYIDKQVSLTDMLGTLKEFFSKFYEKDLEVKFSPDYFPFVEPGGQIALSCIICDGKGCDVCKKTGWLEILGCGMIHPSVLSMAGLDPQTYSGFAWGFGVERLVMLKYNIDDIRNFHSGNLEFIRQF
jgi:phenylalanyl-tRNA synthetase alpha chain